MSTADSRSHDLHYFAALLAGIITVVLTEWSMVRFSAAGWQGDDYVEFYAAGKLAGTGGLYDYPRLKRIESELKRGEFWLPYL